MAKLKCFVIMPFGDEFDPVFQTVRTAASNAMPDEEIDCHWLKDVVAAGRITDDILGALHSATLCVADVTGSNPNVMWETGYAMALDKPTILIGQRAEELPFDLKVHRVLPYSRRTLERLGKSLAEAIRQTLARYEVGSCVESARPGPSGGPVIVVTGTWFSERPRTARRIESLLRPYLACGATWYCGAAGAVDELALEYLLAMGETVAAVAQSKHAASETTRKLVLEGRVPFIDASLELPPSTRTAPSTRDIFFCMKADLIIVLWDGESKHTKERIQYLRENAKNLLVGFI